MTSLLCQENSFHLRIQAYVEEEEGLQKHVMRYPQIFASKAITEKLDGGLKNYHLAHPGQWKDSTGFLQCEVSQQLFSKKGQVAKFYFIVDRLDFKTSKWRI